MKLLRCNIWQFHHLFASITSVTACNIMALRRPPTRIELGVDDISEYNDVRLFVPLCIYIFTSTMLRNLFSL
jgi:Anaphase-promoting complex APC subunit CDC26